jgi:O-antigen/teichoic acid export membrane protein
MIDFLNKTTSPVGFILKSQGILQSVTMIVGNLLVTGFSALALIIISRQLGPEKFGEFSVGFSIVLILTKINEFGTNNVILKFASIDKPHDYNNQIFSQILKFRLLFSFIIVIIGVIFIPLISSLLNFHNSAILAIAFTIGLSTSYYEYLLTILQSLHRFISSIVANFIQSLAKLIAAITLLLMSSHNSVIAYSMYVFTPLLPILLYKTFLPNWVNLFSKQQVKLPRSLMTNVARHSSIALVSAGLIENLDILFVQKYFSSFEAGLYSGIIRIAMLFTLIAYSLAGVLNARVARYNTATNLLPYLKKTSLVVLFALLGFIMFIPAAGLIIKFTVGADYLSGISVMIILVESSFLTIATVPYIALFYAFKEDWYFSMSGLMQLGVMIIGNAVFVPVYGLEAAAWTRLVTKLILLVGTFLLAIWLYKSKYNENSVSKNY